VREEAVTQTGPGPLAIDVAVARVADVGLLRVRVGADACGVTVLDPAYLGFALPLSWKGEYLINGEPGSASSIYMPGCLDSVHIRGGPRDTLGVLLPRDRFVETVAALRGVGPEDVKLDDREIHLPPAVGAALRHRLAGLVHEACAANGDRPPQDIANDAFGILIDAYLHARPDGAATADCGRPAAYIVKMAEECFMAAKRGQISLADLCAAAGVCKSALYNAFHAVYGEAPLRYFRKRRLTQARSCLLSVPPARGAIKRAALGVGFRELGRFSVEYRRYFGESPSVTLSRSAG